MSKCSVACTSVQGAKEREPKRRRTAAEDAEPTVEQVEAEFWRIVESPDQVRSTLSLDASCNL